MFAMISVRDLGNRFAVLLALLMLVVPPISSAEGAPLEVIKSGTQQVLDIVKGCQAGETIRIREHRQEILDVVNQYFDFEEMARRALGRSWRDLAPAKQSEFVKLFKDLLFTTYVDKVETYTCSNESVVFQGQQVEGDYALVKTQVIAASRNVRAQVDYRLRVIDGEWKVYDVVVEGISMINNYRQQFDSILANRSVDDLIKLMREKTSRS